MDSEPRHPDTTGRLRVVDLRIGGDRRVLLGGGFACVLAATDARHAAAQEIAATIAGSRPDGSDIAIDRDVLQAMWRSESLRRREELVAARAAHGSEREQIEGDLERVRTASPLPPAFGAHRDRNAEFAAFGAAAQAFVRVAPLLAEIDASEDLPPEPSPEALALADAWDATTPEIQQSQTQTGDADSVVASAELRVEEARLALAMAPGGLGDSVRADLDRLHRAVVDAEARVFGARRGQRNYAVRRYNRARAAERAALAAAGVDSYAALHLGTTMSESPGDDLAREAAQEQLAAAIEALDAARRSRHLAGGEQLTQRVEQMRARARELLGREPGDDLSGELRALRIDVSARGDRIRQLADVLRRAGVAVGDDVVGQARQFAKTPPSIRVTESLTWPKPGAQFEMPMSEIEQLERRSRDQQQLIVAIDAELTRIDAIGDAGLIDLAADDFAHVFVLILGAYRSGYVLEGRLPIVLDGVLDDVAADARNAAVVTLAEADDVQVIVVTDDPEVTKCVDDAGGAIARWPEPDPAAEPVAEPAPPAEPTEARASKGAAARKPKIPPPPRTRKPGPKEA